MAASGGRKGGSSSGPRPTNNPAIQPTATFTAYVAAQQPAGVAPAPLVQQTAGAGPVRMEATSAAFPGYGSSFPHLTAPNPARDQDSIGGQWHVTDVRQAHAGVPQFTQGADGAPAAAVPAGVQFNIHERTHQAALGGPVHIDRVIATEPAPTTPHVDQYNMPTYDPVTGAPQVGHGVFAASYQAQRGDGTGAPGSDNQLAHVIVREDSPDNGPPLSPRTVRR